MCVGDALFVRPGSQMEAELSREFIHSSSTDSSRTPDISNSLDQIWPMGNMADQTQPKISASLSLDPATHSFSSSEVPMLNLALVLDYHGPITIYKDDLSPSLLLSHGAFTVHYYSSGAEVKQQLRTFCRIPPPRKVAVNLDEGLFYTLLPYTPYTLSSPFAGTDRESKPRAANYPKYLADRLARYGPCSVDGLESGYDYILSLVDRPRISWNRIHWWEYGTKDEVLCPKGCTSPLDARKVKIWSWTTSTYRSRCIKCSAGHIPM